MSFQPRTLLKRVLSLHHPRLLIAGMTSLLVLFGLGIWAITTDLTLVGILHTPQAEHLDQQELNDLVAAGETEAAFDEAFEHGDELFETTFNALDGVGANVGNGQRFTRIPRADLANTGQWATHFPARVTGPNAESCNGCHNTPSDDGAGPAAANVHRDPQHTGVLRRFIERNTPHTFATGAPQRLAEEMTAVLQAIRQDARNQVCAAGGSVTKNLIAKTVDFGTIKVTRVRSHPCRVSYDTSNVKGVSGDLVIRPYQWKGSVAFLRDFNRGAAHNELGMQASEIAGDNVDGDYDGVANELTVGDVTALTVYLAAQPRPTTLIELQSLGLIPPLPQDQVDSIGRGSAKFAAIGCGSCHVGTLTIDNPVFSEPSQSQDYRDPGLGLMLPSVDLDQKVVVQRDPMTAAPVTTATGLDPALPVTFDLTMDQPDNRILDAGGNIIFRLGSLKTDGAGHALVELYGDLKRHYMGNGLAEGIDEVGTGAATFLTENLWGVASTAPYLHDGRATTLTEAILEHGGESAPSKNAFIALPVSDQMDVINFLSNLVLFKIPEE